LKYNHFGGGWQKMRNFDLLQFGVLTARRGWLAEGDVINTGNSGDIL